MSDQKAIFSGCGHEVEKVIADMRCPVCMQIALEAKDKRIAELEIAVSEQAEDYGLWFIAETAPEAYLQNALRYLHALVEQDE